MNIEKIRNQKIVASFIFIAALLILLCVFAIPFTEKFSEDEYVISGFGVVLLGVGLWFLINPYRKPRINHKKLFKQKESLHNINKVKKMISDEKYFNNDFTESSPKINITIGVITLLLGICLITLSFYSHFN